MTSNNEVVAPQFIDPELPVNPIQGKGYDERPINWKSQVYGRYLDSFRWWGNNAWTVLFDWVTTVWKLDRKAVVWWSKVYIPTKWTYLITATWETYWSAGAIWIRIDLILNWTATYTSQNYYTSAILTDWFVQRTEIINLVQWDYLEISLNAPWSPTVKYWYIYIVKLS